MPGNEEEKEWVITAAGSVVKAGMVSVVEFAESSEIWGLGFGHISLAVYVCIPRALLLYHTSHLVLTIPTRVCELGDIWLALAIYWQCMYPQIFLLCFTSHLITRKIERFCNGLTV